MSEETNGHPSRHHWSVALNLSNEEGLYLRAMSLIRTSATIEQAARAMVVMMAGCRTAEGYEYTYKTVLRALEGMKG